MTDMELTCNYHKCEKKLKDVAWVTACSHVFCEEHGTTEFNKASVCPACRTKLNKRSEVLRQELQLSEEFKAMILCGHKPDTIIEMMSRSLSFWMYQMTQRSVYLELLVKKEKETSQQVHKCYEDVIQRAKREISSYKSQKNELKKEITELNRQLSQLREKLSERTRQYQKTQNQYDEMRRKYVNPFATGDNGFDDRLVSPSTHKMPHFQGNDLVRSLTSPRRLQEGLSDQSPRQISDEQSYWDRRR